MAAVDITRLMNSARSRLTGATDDALQLELFNVMDDFFKGSNVWCEDIDFTVPGQDPANTVYFVTSDTPSLIDKLAWVFEVPPSSTIGRGQQIGAAMQIPGEITWPCSEF